MADKLKLTFLGTGASIPTSKRNHTAIALNYKEDCFLIDCGEGTQRQFRKARMNPCKINRILVSHWHGDHVLGLPGLFQTLALSDYNREMKIFGPRKTKEFMKNFIGVFVPVFKFKAEVEEITKEGIFFENEDYYLESFDLNHGIPVNGYNFVLKDKFRIDKKKLEKSGLPPGKHLSELIAGKDIFYKDKKYFSKDFVYLEKGKKISFVLDTVYDKRIADFVSGADVLVCESSFGDEDKKIAREHLHMTAGQAGELAKKAKVSQLFLTHISQRYEIKLNSLIEDAKKNFEEVKIVQDLDSFEF